jgi:hypothetical protein
MPESTKTTSASIRRMYLSLAGFVDCGAASFLLGIWASLSSRGEKGRGQPGACRLFGTSGSSSPHFASRRSAEPVCRRRGRNVHIGHAQPSLRGTHSRFKPRRSVSSRICVICLNETMFSILERHCRNRGHVRSSVQPLRRFFWGWRSLRLDGILQFLHSLVHLLSEPTAEFLNLRFHFRT